MPTSRRPPGPRLPTRLEPHDLTTIEPGGRYEAAAFTSAEGSGQLSGHAAPAARFLGCTLTNCTLTGCDLQQTVLRDVAAQQLRAVGTDLSGGAWTGVEITDSLLSGVQLFDLTADRVTFRDCKLDAVNLRGATLTDARFERCTLTDTDLGSATLRRVSFRDCHLTALDLTKATLTEVDLRGSELHLTRGVESLRGATIDSTQLVALAPTLAAHVGLTVKDDD